MINYIDYIGIEYSGESLIYNKYVNNFNFKLFYYNINEEKIYLGEASVSIVNTYAEDFIKDYNGECLEEAIDSSTELSEPASIFIENDLEDLEILEDDLDTSVFAVIKNIKIYKKYRNSSIGSIFLRKIEQFLSPNVSTVILKSFPTDMEKNKIKEKHRKQLNNFYIKNGYTLIDEKLYVYGDESSAYFLKNLNYFTEQLNLNNPKMI